MTPKFKCVEHDFSSTSFWAQKYRYYEFKKGWKQHFSKIKYMFPITDIKAFEFSEIRHKLPFDKDDKETFSGQKYCDWIFDNMNDKIQIYCGWENLPSGYSFTEYTMIIYFTTAEDYMAFKLRWV